jgi:cellulose synthase/poly-beta-1,6-N-acetylglucosamine synthase-like glycosyltransferase
VGFPEPEDVVVHCCIGIMAYNEEANIRQLLQALLAQKTEKVSIDEIVVVASGCTDRTEEIVNEYVAIDRRVRLLTQPRKEGKASAVNLLLRNTECEVIVLESADTAPLEHTIEALVSPMTDPEVGMVGGRPAPTNAPDHFMGYAAHLLWELHHRVALRHPKLGELIAFRNVFYRIPFNSAVDEASIEPLIVGQGLRLHYAPDALVLNKGPETVSDFLKQRRRIFAGHLYLKETLGYRVSTMSAARLAWLFLNNLKWEWRWFCWAPGVAALEVYVRLMGTYDYVICKRNPYNWAVVASTKQLSDAKRLTEVA